MMSIQGHFFCAMNVVTRFEEMQAKKSSSKPSSTEPKPASHANGTSEPVPSTSRQAASKEIYDVSTDDDDNAEKQLDEDGLPVLPDFFSGQTFLLSGKFKDRRTLVRYIVAYNGSVVLLLWQIRCWIMMYTASLSSAISQQDLSSYTEWLKISENMTLYDSVIVDLSPLNFAYLYFDDVT